MYEKIKIERNQSSKKKNTKPEAHAISADPVLPARLAWFCVPNVWVALVWWTGCTWVTVLVS